MKKTLYLRIIFAYILFGLFGFVAVATIISSLKDKGIDERWLISVAYADTKDLAAKVRRQISESFPKVETELLQLSPSLITHGGPGCIVVQTVLK